MTPDAWIVMGVVIAVIGALYTNKVGPDMAMLSGLIALMLFGVIGAEDALQGFAHPAVFTIGSLFVVAAALYETGATQMLAQKLLGHPHSVTRAQARLMGQVALMSAFMNNTPIVAMYLPIVNDWARRIRISPSKLLMPLSFASILGGKITLLGSSSNLVVMGLYLQYLQANNPAASMSSSKQFWGPAALGIPAAVVGIAFILVCSRWLLPERKPVAAATLDARRYTVQMEVLPESPVVAKSIEEAGLRHLPGLYLTEIERQDEQIPAPSPDFHIRAGDRLSFAGILESVVDLRKIRGLTPATDQIQKLSAANPERALVEAVVSHTSPLVGRTVREARFRTVYNAAIIAVHRNGEQVRAKVGDIRLKPGDTLLMETHRGFVNAHRNSDDFYLVSMVQNSEPIRHEKAWLALAILAALVILIAVTGVPIVVATMTTALVMIAARCITTTQARRSVNRQVVIVIACALGIAEALRQTGAALYAAETILRVAGALNLGAEALLLVTILLASFFGQIVTNNGAAALMFPTTMATAQELGASSEPFMFCLLIGAGLSFVTPISYQTNLMVYGPGGYRFGDFARLGLPLTIITALVAALICPLVFPL